MSSTTLSNKTLNSLADTDRFALTLAKNLPSPPVIGLIGALGAGKTTLVKYLLKALDNHTSITSPTFVWLKTYPISHRRYRRLHHIDVYRLTANDPELANTLTTCQHDRHAVTIIEWADRVRPLLATHALLISIAHRAQKSRQVTLSHYD